MPVHSPETSFSRYSGLELVASSRQQGLNGAIGQQGAQGKAQVGAVEHFQARSTNGLGQALAPKIDRVLQALPATLGKLGKGFLKPAVVVTTPSFRLDGCLSPTIFSGSITPSHSLAHSSSTAWAVVQVGIFETRDLGRCVQIGQVLDGKQHVLDR